jgi:trehalose 2-sulfotransferase
VRLAVSWWRAIKSGEWHRPRDTPPGPDDLAEGYDVIAIDSLLQQSVLREAGLQEMFSEAGIVPLTLAYEDLVQDFGAGVRAVLGHLGLPSEDMAFAEDGFARIADARSEDWVQRFRAEKQRGWPNRGW